MGEERLIESPPRIHDGKDELNLAEFPLCALADRLASGQKTMVFEDRIWDANRAEMITRKLTITGSDEYGLPTAHDDEVLLGLIQLSKLGGFTERRVNFTRYQLIRLLGWRDESKSYARIALSLNRWVGVTLYYDHAWWNRAEQCWVDEKFHVLDNVTLFDRERARPVQGTFQFSSFGWNDVLFRSFAAGNLKSLDFEFFKQLDVGRNRDVMAIERLGGGIAGGLQRVANFFLFGMHLPVMLQGGRRRMQNEQPRVTIKNCRTQGRHVNDRSA